MLPVFSKCSKELHLAPQLTGENVTLRAWRATDFPHFYEMLRDSTTEMAIGIPGVAIDRTSAWRSLAAVVGHWQINGFGEWALSESQGDDLLGYAGFWFPDAAPHVEISWCIHPSFRRRGYARAAAKAALAYWTNCAPDTLRDKPLVANIAEGNIASERVAQALGMNRSEEIKNSFRVHHAWRFRDRSQTASVR